MTFIAKRSFLLLVMIALLPLGAGTVAAQDEGLDTSDWALRQGESTYLLAPEGWVDFNNPEMVSQSLDAASDVSPEFQAMIEAAGPQLEAGLIDIFLGDPATSANVNVLALDVGGELSLAMLEPTMIAQYEQLGAESIEVEQVEIPAGPALRSQYTLNLSTPSGESLETVQIQYALSQETFMYVLTFSTDGALLKSQTPIFDAVAETFGIGEAPAELVAASEDVGTGEKPPAEVVEPAGRDDVVRHNTPWASIVAPPDWFSARDGDAYAEFIATNGGHPVATEFFETLSGDVADGTYSYVLIQPQDLAYMTMVATEIGADIPVSTFREPQETTVKSDPDITLLNSDIVSTPAGDVLIIEVSRPIRQDEEHREIRAFWMVDQNLVWMILAVPEAVYADYQQAFEDIINTISFPEE